MNDLEYLEYEEEIEINLDDEEEIEIDLDDPIENINIKSSTPNPKKANLSSLNEILISTLKAENKELKNQIDELKNNTLLKDKIELGEEIKILNNKNKQLEDRVEHLTNIFDIVSKQNDDYLKQNNTLKLLNNCYINQIQMYERVLKQHQNKEKKAKRKNYSIPDLIELREKGYSYRKIAKIYKVAPSTIYYRINKAIK